MKFVVLKPLGAGNKIVLQEMQNDALMHREGLQGWTKIQLTWKLCMLPTSTISSGWK